jgi:hypothetical protein
MSPLHLAQEQRSGSAARVSQRDTHKANPDEVLLTDWQQMGEDTFVVGARWPQEHDFYTARHGLYDPLILSETIRQCLPLLSHAAYGVPAGHQLLWHDFRWDLVPAALRVEEPEAAIELRITCTDIKYRRNRPATMSLSAQALRADLLMAHLRTRFAIQDRTVYERLRGRYADITLANARALPPGPPAAAHTVGRTRAKDVVLSPTGTPHRWLLRVDTTHPILFDHPVDHAPGMLLLEASRQAAQAAAPPQSNLVVGMDTIFIRYVELDAPCHISARPYACDQTGQHRMLVTAHQRDEEIFTNIVTLGSALSA